MKIALPKIITPILGDLKHKFAQEHVAVGIDIGTAAVKLVKMRKLNDVYELMAFHVEPARTDLVPLLKAFIDPYLQDFRKVNVSFCGPSTIIRYANFPRMKKEEFRAALKFEAEKHIPFAIPEVHIDGAILKDNLPDNKMLVLLAAVKKDLMNQRLKVIEEAGLKAARADLDSLALINAFNFNHGDDPALKNKAVALLNVGASFSNLNIIEAGTPHFSRDFQIAGNHFTQKVADSFGVDFKAAEALKCAPDREKLEQVRGAIEYVLSNLAGEVRLSFDYYESQSSLTVGKIFLSGAGSLCVQFKEMLGSLLGIEVDFWDPFRKITFGPLVNQAQLKPNASKLAVVTGLALSSQ